MSGNSPIESNRSRSRRFSSTKRQCSESVADLQPQHVQVHRLGDEVVRPLTHRLDRRLDRAVGGDYQDDGFGPGFLDLADQIDAGQSPRHLQIGDDDLRVLLLKQGPGLFRILGRPEFVGLARQPLGQAGTDVRFVVDDQDPETVLRHSSSRGGSKGKVMRKVVP